MKSYPNIEDKFIDYSTNFQQFFPQEYELMIVTCGLQNQLIFCKNSYLNMLFNHLVSNLYLEN